MTTANRLQSILDSKLAIKEALERKGLNPSNVLADYAPLIDSLDLSNPSEDITVNLDENKLIYNGEDYNIEKVITDPVCYVGKYETTEKYFKALPADFLVKAATPEVIEVGEEKSFLGNLNCLYLMVPLGFVVSKFGFTNELGYQDMLDTAASFTLQRTYNGVNYTLYCVRETDFTANPEDMVYIINISV